MSQIKQVGPNLWTAPEDMGVTPRFVRTDHAIKHYPKGRSLLHEPLKQDVKTPLKASREETEALGEVFEHCSAGGHSEYLDMRVNSVTNRDMFFYGGLFFAFIWWSFVYFSKGIVTDDFIPSYFEYGIYGLCFSLSILTLFRPLAKPVRFHKKIKKCTSGTKRFCTVYHGRNVSSLFGLPSKMKVTVVYGTVINLAYG